MKVAVIGGSGFVGRNLCRYLAERSYQVMATTREPEKAPVSADSITWLGLDLLESPLVEINFNGVDCVVYLAARAHVLADSYPGPHGP